MKHPIARAVAVPIVAILMAVEIAAKIIVALAQAIRGERPDTIKPKPSRFIAK